MVLKFNNSRQQSHLTLTTTDRYADHKSDYGFKIIWNQSGTFRGLVDNTEVILSADEVLTLAPNQQLAILEPGEGIVFQYNRDFYCILDHDQEVGCVGLLYYGSHQTPIIRLNSEIAANLAYYWTFLKMSLPPATTFRKKCCKCCSSA